MEFTSQVIEENKYVQENYREDSQKSYIESFLLRVKDIPKDTNDYSKNIDYEAFLSIKVGTGKILSDIDFLYQKPDLIVEKEKLNSVLLLKLMNSIANTLSK